MTTSIIKIIKTSFLVVSAILTTCVVIGNISKDEEITWSLFLEENIEKDNQLIMSILSAPRRYSYSFPSHPDMIWYFRLRRGAIKNFDYSRFLANLLTVMPVKDIVERMRLLETKFAYCRLNLVVWPGFIPSLQKFCDTAILLPGYRVKAFDNMFSIFGDHLINTGSLEIKLLVTDTFSTSAKLVKVKRQVDFEYHVFLVDRENVSQVANDCTIRVDYNYVILLVSDRISNEMIRIPHLDSLQRFRFIKARLEEQLDDDKLPHEIIALKVGIVAEVFRF